MKTVLYLLPLHSVHFSLTFNLSHTLSVSHTHTLSFSLFLPLSLSSSLSVSFSHSTLFLLISLFSPHSLFIFYKERSPYCTFKFIDQLTEFSNHFKIRIPFSDYRKFESHTNQQFLFIYQSNIATDLKHLETVIIKTANRFRLERYFYNGFFFTFKFLVLAFTNNRL